MADTTESSIPLIVSVDDHIFEPPDLWAERLPAKYRDTGPRVVREISDASENPRADRVPVDVWHYEDVRIPLNSSFAAAGKGAEEVDGTPITFDDIRPGCYEVSARLADMDLDGVEASLCFPNMFVRFCGQRFLEARDRDLAKLGVEIYNDWALEEWSAASNGRLIPSPIVPLWDVELACAEVRRNAARGATSVCFSEIPAKLGLPSMYSGYWEPFFAACAETGTVINLHIGSSSTTNKTSPDAPFIIHTSNHYGNSSLSLSDWLMSGVFLRHPTLKVAFSEGQAGWIPYLMSRLDGIWRAGNVFMGGAALPDPPSSYLADHVYACVFDDPAILRFLDDGPLPVDNICFETDYPHPDGSWPNSRSSALAQTGTLLADEQLKVLRLNAARLYRMERILAATAVTVA